MDFRSVIHGGTIEHEWEKHYKLKPGDVFIEVGGFWGRYGVLATVEGAKAYLVEPAPANRAEMEKTMQEYGVAFTVIPKAVAASKGTMKFIIAENPSGYRLSVDAAEAEKWKENVIDLEADTLEGILDGLGVDHVDLLASDCENQEVQMMQHAGRWLDQKLIRHLAIGAYHDPMNPDKIAAILQEKGYRNIGWEDSSVLYADA